MPSIEMLLAFSVAALVMNISPGPSNFYVMARSIAQGVRGGVMAAAGLAVGSLVHVAATALGLAAVFKYSPMAYTLVKLLGAAYLIYLGIQYLRASREETGEVRASAVKSYGTIFRESILVEVTNPKTALFFLALLPQFVEPAAGPVAPQLLVLGLIVTISAIPCDLVVAVSASKAAKWLASHENAQVIQNRVSGSILAGLGSYIALDGILADKA